MPACIYCGEDAGAYDEHDLCREVAIELDARLLAAMVYGKPEED